MKHACEILSAHAPEYISTVRALFREYADALGIDLCFQGFREELDTLPGAYAPPGGLLLLAVDNSADRTPAGCVAYRTVADGVCEMKRLYVRPAYRKTGLGREMTTRLVDHARAKGLRTMVLDTLNTMTAALTLYRSLGFVDTQPYSYHPVPGTVCLGLALDGSNPIHLPPPSACRPDSCH